MMGAVQWRTRIYTFGLEEEFFLINPRTRNVVARVPKSLLEQCKRCLGNDRVSHELLQSQIEIVSPVFDDIDQALLEMTRLRRGVADIAEDNGLRMLAAGTAPLSEWKESNATDKPRYARLIEDFQIIGRRNLLCGLHIHVAPPPDVDRVSLMNRLMPWVPLFLALSTSSPFWNRQRTGLLSYRQAAYDEWPRTGIPDAFGNEAEYAEFVDLLVQTETMPDAGFLWWAMRPATDFPTIELRIADCCTDVRDAIAIASLFRCLLRAHVRRPELGASRTALTRRVIDENRWRAKRYGIDAQFIDETSRSNIPVRSLVRNLRDMLAEDAAALNCAKALDHVELILNHGTSAHHQLAVYREHRSGGGRRHDALVAVADWLVQASVPGESLHFALP